MVYVVCCMVRTIAKLIQRVESAVGNRGESGGAKRPGAT